MSDGIGASSAEQPRMTEADPPSGVCHFVELHFVELQSPESLELLHS
jgi:hypothetical protein